MIGNPKLNYSGKKILLHINLFSMLDHKFLIPNPKLRNI